MSLGVAWSPGDTVLRELDRTFCVISFSLMEPYRVKMVNHCQKLHIKNLTQLNAIGIFMFGIDYAFYLHLREIGSPPELQGIGKSWIDTSIHQDDHLSYPINVVVAFLCPRTFPFGFYFFLQAWFRVFLYS